MQTTDTVTYQKGIVINKGDAIIVSRSESAVLLQFDINADESCFCEVGRTVNAIWVSPYYDCTIKEMSCFVFPEFSTYNVFSASVINAGKSIAVCLCKCNF